MITNIWAVLCEQSLINPKTNDISLINTLNSITIIDTDEDKGTFTLDKFLISSKWHKTGNEDEKLMFKITLDGETDNPKELIAQELELEGNSVLAALNFEIDKVTVKEEGFHFISIDYKTGSQRKWRKTPDIPFNVSTKPAKMELEAGYLKDKKEAK